MKTTSKKQEWSDAMLSIAFRSRGLKRSDISGLLDITYETLKKKTLNPELFTGEERIKLAGKMGISLEEIDAMFREILLKKENEILVNS